MPTAAGFVTLCTSLSKAPDLFVFFIINEMIASTFRYKQNAINNITSAPSAVHASTAYKYDALTECATGAW